MEAYARRETEEDLESSIIAFGRARRGTATAPPLTSSDVLAAVCNAGTLRIYADTADTEELGPVITADGGRIFREVCGNTVNQPLVHKVIDRYLHSDAWARELRSLLSALTAEQRNILIYAVICGRIGNDNLGAFGGGRRWEVSLQLHMKLGSDADASKRIGRVLRRMVPSGIVKVPFTPHAPHCFLIARDLEREGIPVNFTSTFSARQAVAAGLLANVTLTNIFMGRLNQGLDAALLGEHVGLAAQRAICQARHDVGIKTLLIIASVREWQTFARVAGCDALTVPPEAIHAFLTQKEVGADAIRNQVETSYDDQLGVRDDVVNRLGMERIARLYRVEPELIEFLIALRSDSHYQPLTDGDQLFKQFDQAGFGDLFYAPTAAEWSALRKSKLPDLASPLLDRVPIDTLYSLLADADFEKHQAAMDAEIEECISD